MLALCQRSINSYGWIGASAAPSLQRGVSATLPPARAAATARAPPMPSERPESVSGVILSADTGETTARLRISLQHPVARRVRLGTRNQWGDPDFR